MSDGEELAATDERALFRPDASERWRWGPQTDRVGRGPPNQMMSIAIESDDERSDGRDSRGTDASAIERLTSAIEHDILPALLRLPGADGARVPASRRDILPEDIDGLVEALLKNKEYAFTVDYIENIRRRPVAVSALFSGLLAPAARELGRMWTDDECSFVDVTVGVSQLQRLVREFGPLEMATQRRLDFAGSVLFAAASGEQHTFGLSLIGEAFRMAGWTVFEAPNHAQADLEQLLKEHHFDVIGFSLGCEQLAETLKCDIERTKTLIDSSNTLLIAGGAAFSVCKDLRESIGADGLPSSADEAMILAEAFVKRRNAERGT